MNDPITIEPDGPKRPAFALWALSQEPPLQTSSASGWDVPLDLYPSVPAELLEGAYIDGYHHSGPVVPAEAQQPSDDPLASLRDLAGEQPEQPKTSTRKRAAARKAGGE